MDMHKIRIQETYHDDHTGCCNIELDDKQIHGVTAYTIEHEAVSLARITLYAYADTALEETGSVEWVVMPQTVDEALHILEKAVDECEGVELERVRARMAHILFKE